MCDSLDAGENVWTKELNPINAAHSKYFNEVSMNWDAAGNPLVIGKESAGCYRMTVDVKMGGTIDSVVMVPR